MNDLSRSIQRPPSRVAFGLIVAIMLGASCNSVPIDDQRRTFSGKVAVTTSTLNRVKLDVLWVVDNSSSMAQEQIALAKGFQAFVDGISTLDVDLRVAVTTTDDTCDRGAFNTQVAKTFEGPSAIAFRHPCETDDDCTSAAVDFNGRWSCLPMSDPDWTENSDGSFNSQCTPRCDSDDECIDGFGDGYFCSTTLNHCQIAPASDGCPDTIEPILDGEDAIAKFGCLATVDAKNTSCTRIEMGLGAGFHALDPAGPQAAQAAAFHRDDAYLVVIFVTDEDDCSPGDGQELDVETEKLCAFLPSEVAKLRPVSDFINRYKSLKSDPSRLIVAVISGDSPLTDPADKEAHREAFVTSMLDAATFTFRKPYICQSAVGTSLWGRRYHEFVEGFGKHGVYANLCGDGGVSDALLKIADVILGAVEHVCLPRAPGEGETVTAFVRNASGQLLSLDPAVDFTVYLNSGCPEVGGHNAVDFDYELAPGEEFLVEYVFAPDIAIASEQ